MQKHRGRHGRSTAMLFKRIGVRGRSDSPEMRPNKPLLEMAQVLQNPVFALLCCQCISVNTLLC